MMSKNGLVELSRFLSVTLSKYSFDAEKSLSVLFSVWSMIR